MQNLTVPLGLQICLPEDSWVSDALCVSPLTVNLIGIPFVFKEFETHCKYLGPW